MKTSLSASEKLSLISNLGTMLSAGIPILSAVDSLLSEAKKNQKKILEHLRDDINQGKTISESFARFPKAFDPVTINLIRAAEEAGTLETTLKDLTVSIKADIEFSSKVRSALTYPAFVMVVFFGIMMVILLFVIPRVGAVFTRLKVNMPLPTKILIFISKTIVDYKFVVLGVTVLLIVLLIFLYKSKKQLIFRVLFSLPLLSRLAREIDITRFCRSMYLLLSSGIPIVEALELSQKVVNKHEVASTIAKARTMISAGKKLSEGLASIKGVFPPLVIRITEAGEKSGTLEKSMQETSEQFDARVTTTLKTLTTLLEPIMLVFIGILVGGIMLAIIAPIYGLIGQIGTR